MKSPKERDVVAGGLLHRVHEWDGGGCDTAVFCHGFLDHGRAWDYVIRELPDSGHYVAFDWRGHGGSEWVGRGGSYHFLDYQLDLADVIASVRRDRLRLVGHSLGGGVASYFAGCFPDQLDSLALLEGLGPPDSNWGDAPPRTAAFVEASRKLRGRQRTTMGSVEEAASRMRKTRPRLSEEQSIHLAEHGTRKTVGGVDWSFDPLHRVPFSQPFYKGQAIEFWRRIRCPTLLIEGGESPYRKLLDLEERCAAVSGLQRLVIAGVGHMMHLEAPAEVARALLDFWRSSSNK